MRCVGGRGRLQVSTWVPRPDTHRLEELGGMELMVVFDRFTGQNKHD
jgi:hypothetical protein